MKTTNSILTLTCVIALAASACAVEEEEIHMGGMAEEHPGMDEGRHEEGDEGEHNEGDEGRHEEGGLKGN